MAKINYSLGINPLPASRETIIKDTLDKAGIPSITVTSTYRTPEQQARAMYDNIVNQGVETQFKLYGPAGDEVIKEYVFHRNAGEGMTDILKAMARKIRTLGPSNVSAHCTADPEKQVTFDILPGSIPKDKKNIFETAMKGITGKFLIPGVTTGELVYHAEIKKELLTGLAVTLLILGCLFFAARKFLQGA
jgi:hypothetical protein